MEQKTKIQVLTTILKIIQIAAIVWAALTMLSYLFLVFINTSVGEHFYNTFFETAIFSFFDSIFIPILYFGIWGAPALAILTVPELIVLLTKHIRLSKSEIIESEYSTV